VKESFDSHLSDGALIKPDINQYDKKTSCRIHTQIVKIEIGS